MPISVSFLGDLGAKERGQSQQNSRGYPPRRANPSKIEMEEQEKLFP